MIIFAKRIHDRVVRRRFSHEIVINFGESGSFESSNLPILFFEFLYTCVRIVIDNRFLPFRIIKQNSLEMHVEHER